MKQLFFITVVLFFTPTGFKASSQTIDSTFVQSSQVNADTFITHEEVTEYNTSDDISSGMLFLMMVGFGFILVSAAVGIILAVWVLILVVTLVSFGVLSTSIIVGLKKKSFAKGFKTFMIFGSASFGTMSFSITFWVFNKISHYTTAQNALINGATCGLLSGLLFGFSAYYILRWLTTYFVKKFNLADVNP